MRLRDIVAMALCGGLMLPAAVAAQASEDAEELLRRGTQLIEKGEFKSAVEVLEGAVRIRPDFAQGWKTLGVAHAAAGDFEGSEEPFRKACELDPKLPQACLYYGRTLYLLNRFGAAVEVLGNVVRVNPRDAQAWRFIALAREASGDAKGAEAAFEKALGWYGNSAPDDDPAIDYGVFLFRQGNAEGSLAPLERAVGRHPDSARAHLELGCSLLALDRLKEAGEQLERAVLLKPGIARAHLLLGKVYLRSGKREAGEEQMRLGARNESGNL